MIRSHVVDRDEDLNNVPATTFQPSDLLILRLLTGMPHRLRIRSRIARIVASSNLQEALSLAQLGFLGLGIMGYRMAGHLLKAGHDVALWSHTGSKAQQLAKAGKGTACATPREVAERADYHLLLRRRYRHGARRSRSDPAA